MWPYPICDWAPTSPHGCSMLAAKVSLLLPLEANYKATGAAKGGTLVIDFTINVGEASLTQRFGENAAYL